MAAGDPHRNGLRFLCCERATTGKYVTEIVSDLVHVASEQQSLQPSRLGKIEEIIRFPDLTEDQAAGMCRWYAGDPWGYDQEENTLRESSEPLTYWVTNRSREFRGQSHAEGDLVDHTG